jgi:diaminopimelate epimerase
MNIQFTKMQGLGNDFMVVDNTADTINLNLSQIQQLADRRFGIGFDQLLMVKTNTTGDANFDYIVYNADGSQVEQCGNGARCFARFVYEKGLTNKTTITAKTLAGIITLHINDDNTVKVNMGKADFAPTTIIHNNNQQDFYYIAGFKMGLVSMGNPHAVIIVDDITTTNVAEIGSAVQNDASFINSVNVNFVQIIDKNTIKVRTFERGVGETLACGSGVCATTAFLHHIGKTNANLTAQLTGGVAEIELKNNVYLSGPAEFVFTGKVEISQI